MQKLGFPTKFKDFKIQNMVGFSWDFLCLCLLGQKFRPLIASVLIQVGSCDVKFPIRLEGLVLTHSQVLDHLLRHINIVSFLQTF